MTIFSLEVINYLHPLDIHHKMYSNQITKVDVGCVYTVHCDGSAQRTVYIKKIFELYFETQTQLLFGLIISFHI